jgi:hypothetical protein
MNIIYLSLHTTAPKMGGRFIHGRGYIRMNKREITKEMLLNYAGNMQDSLIHNLLSQLELEFREQIAKEIEDAIIEVVGDSAATMRQAARIVRGIDKVIQ